MVNSRFSILGGLRIEQTPSYTINYAVRFDPTGNYQYLARNGTYKYGNPYLIPRLALLYHLTNDHHLKLMYGKAIKQASMGENMDIVRYPDRDQLKPANMQTIELNYTGKVAENGFVNLSLFYNNVVNLISRTNQLSNGEMKLINTNSGKLSTKGFEFSTDWKFAQRLGASLSLILQHSENRQKGYEKIELEYAPTSLAYSTISYRFYKTSTIALSGYYIGSMETYWRPDEITGTTDTRTSLQLIADGSRIGEKSPAYFLLNLNVRLNDLFNKNIYCTLHVHNILGTDVKYPTTRSNDEFEKGTFGYYRYFTVGIGYNFGKTNINSK
jgi:outer membrane receptor for ferrienterochelin and colicin